MTAWLLAHTTTAHAFASDAEGETSACGRVTLPSQDMRTSTRKNQKVTKCPECLMEVIQR